MKGFSRAVGLQSWSRIAEVRDEISACGDPWSPRVRSVNPRAVLVNEGLPDGRCPSEGRLRAPRSTVTIRSAIAGITFWNFYFRLYPGTVKSPEVVDFIGAMLRHIAGPLLIVWDRPAAYRARIVRDFLDQQGDRVWVEYLPSYARELNPVEHIWGYWKQDELPNAGSGHHGSGHHDRERLASVRAESQQSGLPFPSRESSHYRSKAPLQTREVAPTTFFSKPEALHRDEGSTLRK